MSQDNQSFQPQEFRAVDQVSVDERARFIVRTYAHLLGAIIAFMIIEAMLLSSDFAGNLVMRMIGGGGFSWLIVLGLFMGVSHVANKWAHNSTSLNTQYAGLGMFIVAEAFVFLPLLYIAMNYGGKSIIPTAGIVTGCVFTGLTSVVFFTRKNFSFLQPFLAVVGMAALGLIIASIVFGFSLGILFTVVMIVVASGYILYSTSNVLHEYGTNQHVAASLTLFASVALLFYYILTLLMSLSRN